MGTKITETKENTTRTIERPMNYYTGEITPLKIIFKSNIASVKIK